MAAICPTDADVEATELITERAFGNNTDLMKLQQHFDDVQIYFAWYGVAMPVIAAFGVVLNVVAFRFVGRVLFIVDWKEHVNVQFNIA